MKKITQKKNTILAVSDMTEFIQSDARQLRDKKSEQANKK